MQPDIDARMQNLRYTKEASLVGDSAATLRALLRGDNDTLGVATSTIKQGGARPVPRTRQEGLSTR